jgi:hypothetical protein
VQSHIPVFNFPVFVSSASPAPEDFAAACEQLPLLQRRGGLKQWKCSHCRMLRNKQRVVASAVISESYQINLPPTP